MRATFGSSSITTAFGRRSQNSSSVEWGTLACCFCAAIRGQEAYDHLIRREKTNASDLSTEPNPAGTLPGNRAGDDPRAIERHDRLEHDDDHHTTACYRRLDDDDGTEQR